MKYNILYTGIFLDNKSEKNIKNWFKLKTQDNLLDNICSDVAILSIVKKRVGEDFLSKISIGKEVQLEVVGYIDKEDIQVALCKAIDNKLKDKFYKIVISTNLKKVNLSRYNISEFIECNGPKLNGTIGILNYKKEKILNISSLNENT